MEKLDEKAFLLKFNIDEEKFNRIPLSWEQLVEIHEDYCTLRKTLVPIANEIADLVRTHPDVHTVKSRIKDPERLIEKIIRKSIEKDDEGYNISIENYTSLISDLIGIRVLHLYKDQATTIDKWLRKTWPLKEKATIYYRKGDNVDAEAPQMSDRFDFKEHPAGYRSWHYLIQTSLANQKNVAEVQVRTIFEEGWSEVDHELRYHYELSNPLLVDQLLVLNRIAGSADEMANTIRETKRGLDKLVNQNKEYKATIEELSQDLDHALSDNTSKIQLVEELQEKLNAIKPTLYQSPIPYVGLDHSKYVIDEKVNISEESALKKIKGTHKDIWEK